MKKAFDEHSIVISFDKLKTYLAIDKDDLDTCLMEQPSIFFEVATALANANAERDAAKLVLEEEQAKLDQDLRKQAERAGEKVTESSLQNKLRILPKIQELQAKFADSRHKAEAWSVLKESFIQRSFMLRELVALYISQRHDHAMEAGSGQPRAALAERNRQDAGLARKRLSEQA